MIIKKITAKETYVIRHPILRKGLPLESCKFENDNNPNSIHLCAIEEDKLIAIISALPNKCPDFPEKKAYQIRGVAVLEEYRGKGVASTLMKEIEKIIKEKYSIDLIWLNSRIKASKLYLKNNYKPYGEVFEVKYSGVHQSFYKSQDLKFN